MHELLPHFIIIVIISVFSFFLLHEYFPIKGTTPNSKKNKNFWVIALTITLFVFETLFVFLFHTVNTIDELKDQVHTSNGWTEGLDASEKEAFKNLITSYKNDLPRDQYNVKYIKNLFTAEIKEISSGIKDGKMVLLDKNIKPKHMKSLYDMAQESIISINVGDLSIFFNDRDYVNKIKKQIDNDIPVVQIFIYTDTTISIERFTEEVKQLHNSIKLYKSYIVVYKNKYLWKDLPLKDLSLVDSKYLSESTINYNSQTLYTISTNKSLINDTKDYLFKIINNSDASKIFYSDWGSQKYRKRGEQLLSDIERNFESSEKTKIESN